MGNYNLHILALVLIFIVAVNASWGTPGSGQYHIQTDEGPERYFKYQTDNGQYRREKRLQDGTVIGTDAWIDAFGYLRQKDYIADNQGYRILKSKTVFVGQNRPIEEAMKEAKKTPPSSGILVPTHSAPPTTPSPTTPETIVQITPSSIAPPSIAKGYEYPKVQNIFIQPNAEPPTALYLPTPNDPPTSLYLPASNEPPSSDYLPPKVDIPRQNYILTNTLEPPLALSNPTTTPRPTYNIQSSTYPSISSSTPIAVLNLSPTPTPITSNSIHNNEVSSTASAHVKTDHLAPIAVYSAGEAQKIVVDSYINGESGGLVGPAERATLPQNFKPYVAPISSTTARPFADSYPSKSLVPLNSNKFNAQPIYNRNNIESYPQQYYQTNYNKKYEAPKAGSAYNSQYASYDGVSATSNGFRYFLPRQYHEEENSKGGDRKDGSYGYIDPFGIRRVVYYNAGPGGFNHRKNNRYVGFNATPYDPRPT